MSQPKNNPQYGECGKCHGTIINTGRGWYHQSPPLHYPRHYPEPRLHAVFTPEVFARTVQQMAQHVGLVGEL